MIKNLGIAVAITVIMLWAFSALMNSAIADVLVLDLLLIHNLLQDHQLLILQLRVDIIVRVQQTTSQDLHHLQLQQTLQLIIIILILVILELYRLHQLLASLLCLKTYVLLV